MRQVERDGQLGIAIENIKQSGWWGGGMKGGGGVVLGSLSCFTDELVVPCLAKHRKTIFTTTKNLTRKMRVEFR